MEQPERTHNLPVVGSSPTRPTDRTVVRTAGSVAVKTVGEIPGLTGDGDVRTADVRLQAAFGRTARKGQWAKTGPSLSMSPQTGTQVRRVTDVVINGLLTPEDLAHVAYLGGIYRNDNLALPVNMRDFADDRGAIHTGIFGTTGPGKSAIATLVPACQFRHSGLGVLFIDPQGQFSDDRKTLLPLQGLARALGRHTERLRIAHDIQLDAEPELLCDMLSRTEFFKRLDMSHPGTTENASRAIRDFLEDSKSWTETSPEDLLTSLLDHLSDQEILDRIIKDARRQKQIISVIQRVRSGTGWDQIFRIWAPLHSLFTKRNLTGGRRLSAHPAGDTPDATAASDLKVLEDEGLKARLLRMIVGMMRSVGKILQRRSSAQHFGDV
jgi:hypothetical protein